MTVRDGVNVSYYTQPVDSADQATSLVEYLIRHGFFAFASEDCEVQIPLEALTKQQVAAVTSQVFLVVSSWRLYWQHSDAGVFELDVYVKD